MKAINQQAAQGDIYIRRVAAIPADATRVEPERGRYVVAHSETGHDHYVPADGVAMWADPRNSLVCYLRTGMADAGGSCADLIHAREFDTHETLRLPPGDYEIRRQREFRPSGWQRVED